MGELVDILTKYETYVLITVRDGEHDEYAGMKVLADGDLVPVLPLNGWRARNVAEQLFGERDSGFLKLGTAKLVRASFLQDLPGLDPVYEAYLARFRGVVAIEVVAVEPGYGCYITVEQMEGQSSEDALWAQQLKILDGRTAHLRVSLPHHETGRLVPFHETGRLYE